MKYSATFRINYYNLLTLIFFCLAYTFIICSNINFDYHVQLFTYVIFLLIICYLGNCYTLKVEWAFIYLSFFFFGMEQLSKSERDVSKFASIALVDVDSEDVQVYVKYFDITFIPSTVFFFNAHHMKMDSGYSSFYFLISWQLCARISLSFFWCWWTNMCKLMYVFADTLIFEYVFFWIYW